jgi:hypothetical protein
MKIKHRINIEELKNYPKLRVPLKGVLFYDTVGVLHKIVNIHNKYKFDYKSFYSKNVRSIDLRKTNIHNGDFSVNNWKVAFVPEKYKLVKILYEF